MRSENILSADILDLIFENRNKSYGAYMLRKNYNSRLVKSLLLTFLAVGIGLLFTQLFKERRAREYTIADAGYIKLLPEVIAEKQVVPKPPAPTKQAAKKRSTEQWVSNVVITREETRVSKLSKNLDSAVIGSSTREVPSPGGQLVTEPGIVESGTGTNPEAVKVVDKEIPRLTAELMPAFPGGMEALRKFLERNLRNPEDVEPGTVIAVKIRVIVGYDGKLKGFQIIEDGGEPFNNEVLRVLKKMPEWIPGKSDGEKVSVYYTIPVKFTSAE
jgi:protein TonB